LAALLELDHIAKRFGRVVVADDVTFSMAAGDAMGVVGPNGAGKTSVFAIIAGELAPDAGDVRFGGRSLAGVGLAGRCRLGISRTYQVPRPFEAMTVFENTLVAAQQGAGQRGQASYALASGALERAGLAREANDRAGTLGLLQRKRLELARALATQPQLLLLDEVAGGLTDPEVAQLVQIVRDAREGGTAVIWIEHVVRALLDSVDRLICLASGRIVGDGDPAEVLASPQVRDVFLGTEATAESLRDAAVDVAGPAARR
jgi:branched-chain amino acid transport system ATP-binding protein